MHQQIRVVPARSPANLPELLSVLAEAGFNLASAGGSEIENGGEFAFGFEHAEDDEAEYERAITVLEAERYKPRRVDVDVCLLTNEPGQLLECITGIAQQNVQLGRSNREIAVGVPNADGLIQVQVYSE
jgi:hypothetical protein